jgi:3-deoxy-D-manno-octulosonic-acid transferase
MSYRQPEFGNMKVRTSQPAMHKLCANVFINARLSHQSVQRYLYCSYQNRNNSWKPDCVVSLNMG